jgi:hypothetical protein
LNFRRKEHAVIENKQHHFAPTIKTESPLLTTQEVPMKFPEIWNAQHTKKIHLGCQLPIATPPMMRLANYRRKSMPTPPSKVGYGAKATKTLGQAFLNTSESDCVIAAGGHLLGVVSANSGTELILTDAQVNVQYSAIGGYVPGNPATDTGCNPYVALAYWMETGWPQGVVASGMALMDALDQENCMDGIFLFENALCWLGLPDKWINPFPEKSGFIWDLDGPSNPANGHMVMAYGYGRDGLLIDSWGLLGLMTWPAVQKYLVPALNGGIATLLLSDTIANGENVSPSGFAWANLKADIYAMGGMM